MDYDMMFRKAQEMTMYRQQNGSFISPEDTICVIASENGRIFTGMNRYEEINGQMVNIHAEAETIKSLQLAKESGIQTVLLVSASTGVPMLPCQHCLRSIALLATQNGTCEIMMHDRAVPITELSEFTKSQPVQPSNPAKLGNDQLHSTNLSVSVGVGSQILKNRVSSLLEGMDDTDEEEKSRKGILGGLFKRK
ncbi:MAG: cytidine deaminase [Oscillospiraceae bacterium]|nr:cytidine deaminase [Oscillospiraceae bacterium]